MLSVVLLSLLALFTLTASVVSSTIVGIILLTNGGGMNYELAGRQVFVGSAVIVSAFLIVAAFLGTLVPACLALLVLSGLLMIGWVLAVLSSR